MSSSIVWNRDKAEPIGNLIKEKEISDEQDNGLFINDNGNVSGIDYDDRVRERRS